MTQIEAVYEGGVFRPLEEVKLPEKQRVRLSVQPVSPEEAMAWLRRAQALRQQVFEEQGYFPDSTQDIAEDRRR